MPPSAPRRSAKEGPVTKADLVDEISGKTRISKSETATIVDQLLNAISRALSEGKHIEIRGFGTFKVRERKARKARNPRSGAEVMVPAKLVPVFKASNELKGAVRG
ncbi:MAG TPA: HU family DNA-binding protein [Candidatus Angelobacter sp.]|nr:HU family DNA-binding protein [Candidatus Angelobacter sp.]